MPLSSADVLDAAFDVCIVGAGPAGLACAFDCHDAGLKTLVLEAGGHTPIPGEPDVRAAEIIDPAFHDPIDIVAASALGGSSHWWGGRCVPFDRADFRTWPIGYDDMLPWWEKAAEFLGARSVSESDPPPAFTRLTRFDALRDECWGPQLNMARRWRTRIMAAHGPAILLGARVTGLDHAEGRVTQARVRIGGVEKRARARHFVLTSGGLGALRLLLLTQRDTPALFGGGDGPLGRAYMGHLTGSVAALAFTQPADARAFFTRPLDNGVHARRRLRPTEATVSAEPIVNTAFWLDNASAENPAHGDAIASARYLATRMLRAGRGEGALAPHIANITRAPITATMGLARAASLLAAAKLTGAHPHNTRLTPITPGAWRVHYHAEQTRDPNNRISLSAQTDSIGLPKLKIDFRMRDADFDGVLRAHELLDEDLRDANAGTLRWDGDRAASRATIQAAARDGYHQLGGAAMSADPRDGVVNTDCRTHDLGNLYVAAGSVFPSSGQANPTLTIVALARRVAGTLAGGEY